jgi:hypothetical protein
MDAGKGFVLPLQQLPKPMLARVLLFLPLAHASRLSLLCARFSAAFGDEVAWRERLLREPWPEAAAFPTSDFREAFRSCIWNLCVSCEHDHYGHVVYASFHVRVHAETSIRELQLLLSRREELSLWVQRRQITHGALRAADAEKKTAEPLWGDNLKPRPVLGECEDRRRLCDFECARPSGCTLVLTLFFRA